MNPFALLPLTFALLTPMNPDSADGADGALAAPGRVGGEGSADTRVLAHSTDVFHIRFEGGKPAEIVVNGDGDTDLDLYVYDENDNLIVSDTDALDLCIANWTPRWTGTFRVEVKNLGDVYNRYSLRTN